MELDCGIKRSRIVAWLDDELKLPREGGGWVFREGGAACRIEAEELEPRAFAHIELDRTALRIEGDEPAVQAFLRRFTLHFASAGG